MYFYKSLELLVRNIQFILMAQSNISFWRGKNIKVHINGYLQMYFNVLNPDFNFDTSIKSTKPSEVPLKQNGNFKKGLYKNLTLFLNLQFRQNS